MRNSTEVSSSNLTYDEVYSTQHYVINFISDLRQIRRWFSPVSSIDKTDHWNIVESVVRHQTPSPTVFFIYEIYYILTITLNNRSGITCETATAYPPVHISLTSVFWRDPCCTSLVLCVCSRWLFLHKFPSTQKLFDPMY
jgi:hypothetical protein